MTTRRPFDSLTARLVAGLAVALVVVMLVAGWAISRSAHDSLEARARMELSAAIGGAMRTQLGAVPPRGPGTPPPPDGAAQPAGGEATDRRFLRATLDAEGDLLTLETSALAGEPDVPPSAEQLALVPIDPPGSGAPTPIRVAAEDGSLDYLAAGLPLPPGRAGATLVMAVPLDDVDAALADLQRTLLLVGGLGFLAVMLAATFVVRRGLQPVHRLEVAADAVARGDLDARVGDVAGAGDMQRVAATFDGMVANTQATIELQAAIQQRLRRFVADASHELRTPLTALRGHAELFRMGALDDPEKLRQSLGRIEVQSRRMADLVDDLLAMAEVDQPPTRPAGPVDVGRMVEDLMADLHAVDPDRPISVDTAPEAIVHGDGERLQRIVENLLSNARKHTAPDAWVGAVVRVDPDAERVVIEVQDHGDGIAPEDLDRVFDRFWRGDKSRARAEGSSGLGLAIVDKVVEQHGGSVTVTSEVGQGTTFTVALPLARVGARHN